MRRSVLVMLRVILLVVVDDEDDEDDAARAIRIGPRISADGSIRAPRCISTTSPRRAIITAARRASGIASRHAPVSFASPKVISTYRRAASDGHIVLPSSRSVDRIAFCITSIVISFSQFTIHTIRSKIPLAQILVLCLALLLLRITSSSMLPFLLSRITDYGPAGVHGASQGRDEGEGRTSCIAPYTYI